MGAERSLRWTIKDFGIVDGEARYAGSERSTRTSVDPAVSAESQSKIRVPSFDGRTAGPEMFRGRPFTAHRSGASVYAQGTCTVFVTLFFWPFVSVTVSVTERVLVCQ